jgi:hypothetical protein
MARPYKSSLLRSPKPLSYYIPAENFEDAGAEVNGLYARLPNYHSAPSRIRKLSATLWANASPFSWLARGGHLLRNIL